MRILVVRPSLLDKISFNSDSIFIVIDTFRATTSLSALKNAGVNKFYVVKNREEAEFLKNKCYKDSLLVGEEKGLKIEGFDFGNTPSYFFEKKLSNETVIFTSSNGAKTLLLLESSNQVYLAALVNMSFVAQEISKLAKQITSDIMIIPAGYYGDDDNYTLEDWVTAVILAEKISIMTSHQIEVKDDFWKKTQTILKNQTRYEELLKNSKNGMYLQKLGFENDVDFSISMDKISNFLKVKKWQNFNDLYYVELE